MKHDFICVGFPKCATTTLDAIFRQHPEILLPCHKETLFFERQDLYSRGEKWYSERYYGKKVKVDGKKVGEVNPRVSNLGNKEKLIQTIWDNDVKFIYIMRDPVDAIFSWYKQEIISGGIWKEWKDNLWTEDCFDFYIEEVFKENNNILRNGIKQYLYGRHLKTALRNVKRENIYIVIFEEFINNPEEITKKLFEFIGVNPNVNINYKIKKNSGDRKPISIESMKKARRCYQFWHSMYVPYFPYMGSIIERVLDRWYWNISEICTIHTNERMQMSEKTRLLLQDYYRSDVKLVEEIIEKDLSKFWFS